MVRVRVRVTVMLMLSVSVRVRVWGTLGLTVRIRASNKAVTIACNVTPICYMGIQPLISVKLTHKNTFMFVNSCFVQWRERIELYTSEAYN